MVAHLGFGGRRENHFGQLFRLAQAFGQLNAADRAAFLIFLPAAAAQIAAYHRFDFHRREPFRHHRAVGNRLGFGFRQHVEHSLPREMVGHDVRQFAEPEIGNLRQDFAFPDNGLVQNHIKCRQSVGGDNQHGFAVDFVQIAHLARIDFFERKCIHHHASI